MGKKLKWLWTLLLICFFANAYSQTITVGGIDPGPYGQNSSIGVPISINDAGSCIQQNNVYHLYLSDATGDFSAAVEIGQASGFYSPFVNGIIPNGTPAGTGYRVQVRSTNPVIVSSTSAAFEISTLAGSSPVITSGATIAPGVFGSCGNSTTSIALTNGTAAGNTVTASLTNNQTSTSTNIAFSTTNISQGITNADYTLLAKALTSSGIVSTRGYQIINNPNNTSFTTNGTTTVCVNGTLNFSVSANDLEKNYPGNFLQDQLGRRDVRRLYAMRDQK